MPATQQLERQICDWIKEPRKEVYSVIGENSPTNALTFALGKHVAGVSRPSWPRVHFAFCGERDEENPEQDIWDLAQAVRVKVARDSIEEYESQRLIDEINEAYDEEMEREDEEFLRYARRYQKRILDPED